MREPYAGERCRFVKPRWSNSDERNRTQAIDPMSFDSLRHLRAVVDKGLFPAASRTTCLLSSRRSSRSSPAAGARRVAPTTDRIALTGMQRPAQRGPLLDGWGFDQVATERIDWGEVQNSRLPMLGFARSPQPTARSVSLPVSFVDLLTDHFGFQRDSAEHVGWAEWSGAQQSRRRCWDPRAHAKSNTFTRWQFLYWLMSRQAALFPFSSGIISIFPVSRSL